jgi:two-component system, LytTR family, response regulator
MQLEKIPREACALPVAPFTHNRKTRERISRVKQLTGRMAVWGTVMLSRSSNGSRLRPTNPSNVRPLRALVADDDKLCRQRTLTLLASHPDIEVVGECSSGRQIVESLRELEPDVLLLDPKMREANVFELLAPLKLESLPLLIFTSAQDQYAVRAFETGAFDFILKPYKKERFLQAIERARLEVSRYQEDLLTQRQINLIRELRSISNERLIVKCEGKISFLEFNEIDWIEAAANYVTIHVGLQAHRLRLPIGQIENRVSVHGFSRIHRSVIVNLAKISEAYPCNSGEYMVCLKNGKELPCSRKYNSALRALLEDDKTK